VRKVSPDGTISIFAGTGVSGNSGNGGPATAAKLSNPYCIVVDKFDNVYIGEFSVIRKINTAGIITNYAGTGISGASGTGGPATAAQLMGIRGLAIDGLGNMYVSDIANNVVRKIDNMGIITRVAGTGLATYNGDTLQATDANISEPVGLATDKDNNLYIVSYSQNRVRKVTPDGIITTVAGTGVAGYSGDGSYAASAKLDRPSSICIDKWNNLYVTDSYNDCVRKITTTGVISTIAGNGLSGFEGDGGPATAAKLLYPAGIITDEAGGMLLCDWGNNRVRRVNNVVSVADVSSINNGIDISPNPNSGSFNLRLTSMYKNEIKVAVTNIVGKVVKEIFVKTNEKVTVILDAPSGIYFVTAFTDAGILSKKITLIK
jgi:sugar lactone lactonase YvrE